MRGRWGNRVMKKLERLGKTQKDLAAAIYYSPTHLCDVINGRYCPEVMEAAERTIKRWEQEAMYRR